MNRRDMKRKAWEKRSSETIVPHTTIRIYCNGVTEELYFNSLKKDLSLRSVRIEVESSAYCRKSLVEQVAKKVKDHGIRPDEYTEIWIVFDVDDDIDGQTDNAISMCMSKGYHYIVSNECFEVWIRLHYDFFDSALSRKTLFEYLSGKLAIHYEKNKAISLYPLLQIYTNTAIKHAEKLASRYEGKPVSHRNPYTNVYRLVSRLLALKQDASQNMQ